MDRLHTKGYISDPKSQAKSVVMTEEGEKLLRGTSAARPDPICLLPGQVVSLANA